jgi:hypothetical protein
MLVAGAALASAGCGGDDDGGEPAAGSERGPGFQRKLELAQHPAATDFPAGRGKTLQQVADGVVRVQAGLASSEFTPGRTGSRSASSATTTSSSTARARSTWRRPRTTPPRGRSRHRPTRSSWTRHFAATRLRWSQTPSQPSTRPR